MEQRQQIVEGRLVAAMGCGGQKHHVAVGPLGEATQHC